MIKTNIKMRVTPEQLIEIGKIIPICKRFTEAKYIFIYKDGSISWGRNEYRFDKKETMQEIDPELFIRTNGSCVEKEEFTYPMWFESKITKEVVRFDGLSRGEVIVSKNKAFPVGFYSSDIEPHTSIVWKQIENPNLATDKDNNKAKNPNSKHYELWENFEAIDVIKLVLTDEEYKGFLKGNILKYQLRLGKKDDVSKEIEKIKDYERELKNEN